MGIERIAIAGAQLIEHDPQLASVGARLLEEVAQVSPNFARTFGIETQAARVAAPLIGAEAQIAKLAAPLAGKEAGAVDAELFRRAPRELTEAETDAQLERLLNAMDDRSIGLPPKELTNQGLGARLWQFGTAGGDVLRERAASEVTKNWAPELAASRQWLSENPQAFNQFRPLPEAKVLGPVQNVEQGMSTQFAAGPLSTALRTDNVATCAAIYCRDGERQFLGHADGMIHHRAVTEALEAAGINLDTAHVTLMPGPLKSPVLETILPAFMKDQKVMSNLRIIPFRGPAHGSVVAQDGALFVPKP